MANELTFGYLTGKTLLAFVYQADGTERDFGSSNNGIAMTEVAGAGLYDGFYLGDCATIAAGDFVIITDTGVTVGQGQYKPEVSATDITSDIADVQTAVDAVQVSVDAVQTDVTTLLTGDGKVLNVVDETEKPPAFQVIVE